MRSQSCSQESACLKHRALISSNKYERPLLAVRRCSILNGSTARNNALGYCRASQFFQCGPTVRAALTEKYVSLIDRTCYLVSSTAPSMLRSLRTTSRHAQCGTSSTNSVDISQNSYDETYTRAYRTQFTVSKASI